MSGDVVIVAVFTLAGAAAGGIISSTSAWLRDRSERDRRRAEDLRDAVEDLVDRLTRLSAQLASQGRTLAGVELLDEVCREIDTTRVGLQAMVAKIRLRVTDKKLRQTLDQVEALFEGSELRQEDAATLVAELRRRRTDVEMRVAELTA